MTKRWRRVLSQLQIPVIGSVVLCNKMHDVFFHYRVYTPILYTFTQSIAAVCQELHTSTLNSLVLCILHGQLNNGIYTGTRIINPLPTNDTHMRHGLSISKYNINGGFNTRRYTLVLLYKLFFLLLVKG